MLRNSGRAGKFATLIRSQAVHVRGLTYFCDGHSNSRFFGGSEGEEEQQQDEPREGVEGSEAHDVFGESDKEGESEEVEEHHRHEEGSRDSSEAISLP